MSWSTSRSGKVPDVRADVMSDLDSAAKAYEGTEEAEDIIAAKERVLAALDEYGADAEARVSAYGSRSNGRSVEIHVNVGKK